MAFQIVGIFIGIILFVFGFFALNRKNQIAHTPTSKIRSLAMGLVEIKGIAKANDYKSDTELDEIRSTNIKIISSKTDISPLTKKKCVYYCLTIEEERGSGKNKHWVCIHMNVYANPFYVQDDTGKILIDPTGAKLELSTTFMEDSRFGKDPSKVVMDYLKEKNINFEGFLGVNKKMKYTEKAIFADSEIYVLGEAMSSGNSSSVQHENIIIGKKGKWGMYYISNMPEKEILKKFNKTIYPLFIIGGIIIMVSVISLIMAFVNYH